MAFFIPARLSALERPSLAKALRISTGVPHQTTIRS